ncbi:MAG: transposase [Chloroflexota bacterium]
MDGRQERGLQIAALAKLERNKLGWKVPSQSGNGTYIVNLDHGTPFCTCPDFENGNKCKHIYAVEFTIQRETKADGTTIETKSMRITYGQEWHEYNQAQTHEAERFVDLLRDLCNGIPQPEQRIGRPRLPLSDVVFSAALKVYSGMSGRRAISDLKECASRGYVTKAPHYNSTSNYLDNPALTPLLKALIEESAKPLKTVETDFAVDSSGFATTTYSRWFDHKYGKERTKQTWVKTHLMCGVKTNVVTSVEASPFETADAPQLPALLNTTAQTFAVREVSGDKAYSSKRNLTAIDSVGATPYIPFKSYCKGTQRNGDFNSLWDKMWHFYEFNRAAFLERYHKRSNAETTFSMIKAKFGGSVRSKSPVAQVNEVLCKVLCHNICVLIQSIYEFGLVPTFWANHCLIQQET